MFDPKSLLEDLMRGGRQGAGGQGGQGGGLGELGDLLRQFTEQRGGGGSGQGQGTGTNALDDLLRQFNPDRSNQGQAGDGGQASQTQGGGQGLGLDDILRELNQNRQGSHPAAPGAGSGPGAGGGLGDLLGQVFGQKPEGQGGADPRGAGQSPDLQEGLRNILEKFGGRGANADDVVRKITDFIGNNKVGAGAAIGGLGALILGTRTGRSIAINAAKLGALAAVGGLAYKAYQNYQQGQAPAQSGNIVPEAAPTGTGFEEHEVSGDAARTMVRAMIAAAAADGRFDANEQERILGSLKEQGLDGEAEAFLASELNNPASIEDLARGVANQAEALQVYTAARVSIDPDTHGEKAFLFQLAERLGIPEDLRAHIDAGARGMV